ncbi:MAG: hypothetical protein ACOC1P_04115 [Minisyncoccales bacterium]
MGIIKRKRIKYAFKFGKLEHKFGRYIGLMIFFTFLENYFYGEYTKYFLIITFITWIIYLSSHHLEKACFGNHGPRSGWK